MDVQSGPLDTSAVDLLAAALPVVIPADEAAADGDQQFAQLIALWRAARGPLLNDQRVARALETVILRKARDRVAVDGTVAAVMSLTCDELLWPLSYMLLADEWRADLTDAAPDRGRPGLVVAPPPLFGQVPWAALPLTDSDDGPVTRLIEAADVLIGLPASLAAGLHRPLAPAPGSRRAGVVVADPLGDLPFARHLAPEGMTILGSAGSAPATKAALAAALGVGQGLLVVNGHVRPGSPVEPASSALMLAGPDDDTDPMTVTDFAAIGVPPQCVVLGCDGAGAATGTEWTGLVTGLVWAGAREVVTTTVPVVEDGTTAILDAELVGSIRSQGAANGLIDWQKLMAARYRGDPSSPDSAPYRWAQTVAVRSAVHEVSSMERGRAGR